MRHASMNKYAICLGALFLSCATMAVASSGGHGEEPATFMGDWLPRLVNFAIIAGVVFYFGRKPIRDFFKNRTNEIAKAIQESKEAAEQAAADLAEMERKVKALESEIERMVADAKVRGENDRQVLMDEGKKMVLDIQGQVKQGIDLEVHKARTALQTEASLLALELAEGKIKESIGTKDHQRIVKEYISNVGGKG